MTANRAEVTVREFVSGDENAFRRLNEEWIVRYFKLEEKDLEAFANPQEKIIDTGGRIFFAVRGGEPIGVCALVTIAPGEFEVAKMGVTASAQGLGAGRMVLDSCVNAARQMGARRLYLETNHALTPAIHLYEAVGFQHLPKDRLTPSPYARSDVFMEMWL
jgi:N-acetylglutamate synthase-like GNAT family acetyltransferase